MRELTFLPHAGQHDRLFKLVGGYAAFISALLILTLTLSSTWPAAWVVTTLFSLSEPALVAYILLDFKVRVVQGRKASMFRGLSILFGFFPSLIGTSILIGHFSLLAMALFLVSVFFWLVILWAFAVSGKNIKEWI